MDSQPNGGHLSPPVLKGALSGRASSSPFLYFGLLSLLAAVTLWVTWQLTMEPGRGIHVRWRDGVAADTRIALERQYLLVNAQQLSATSWAYDLVDTGRRNVQALVQDPRVADTHHIDRHSFDVEPEAPYSDAHMWAARRVPFLRNRTLMPGLFHIGIGLSLVCFWMFLAKLSWQQATGKSDDSAHKR